MSNRADCSVPVIFRMKKIMILRRLGISSPYEDSRYSPNVRGLITKTNM